jgi:hypothetical protein
MSSKDFEEKLSCARSIIEEADTYPNASLETQHLTATGYWLLEQVDRFAILEDRIGKLIGMKEQVRDNLLLEARQARDIWQIEEALDKENLARRLKGEIDTLKVLLV